MPINYKQYRTKDDFIKYIDKELAKESEKKNFSLQKVLINKINSLENSAKILRELNNSSTPSKLYNFIEYLKEKLERPYIEIESSVNEEKIIRYFSQLYENNNIQNEPYLNKKTTEQFLRNAFVNVEGRVTNQRFALNISKSENGKQKMYGLFYGFFDKLEKNQTKNKKKVYARMLKEHFTNFDSTLTSSISDNMHKYTDKEYFL